jgi:hypothetical protein
MTYLEMVNAVLRKLREDTVQTVNENDYSTLVGMYINDAKRIVEDSWDWSTLRTTQNVTTSAGTSEYSLAGFGLRSEVHQVFDDTEKRVLNKMSLKDIRKYNMLTDDAQDDLRGYAFNGVDSNGDIKITLFPTPEGTRTVSVYGIKRTNELTSDSDTTFTAPQSIVALAFSTALDERGETGGQSGAQMLAYARQELSNAIALDANQHEEELTWTTV